MKKINEKTSIWEKKYVPYCIEDLILPPQIKESIQKAVNSQELPHFGLFSSIPGTGKSSTAHAIVREINGEALWINASKEGIDIIRGKLEKFASSSAFDDNIKIVVMDEFDNISSGKKDAQLAFRGFLDEFGHNCRFIFTGNYQSNIIEPLLERMEKYDYNNFNKKEMVKPIFDRLKYILENENIQYDQKLLIPIINTYYPRIRSMVMSLQQFSRSGVLTYNEGDLDNVQIYDQIMKLLKSNYLELITEVNKLNAPDNMYTFLYKNAGKYFKENKYPDVVLIIAKYQHMSFSVRDKNLNLGACLTELMRL
jgi:replication factor C small subunit